MCFEGICMEQEKQIKLEQKSTSQKFLEDLKESFKAYNKEIPIIIHNFPDPDAISSAFGMLTEPSSFWWFSRMATMIREVAIAVLFNV